MLSFYAAFSSMMLAFGLLLTILNPRVNDGISVKLGLALMTLGLFFCSISLMDKAASCRADSLEKSLLLVNIGAIIVLAGYAFRRAVAGKYHRRASDWIRS